MREKAPRLITEEDLTAAGFKPNAAIRKRITGKDLNDQKSGDQLILGRS